MSRGSRTIADLGVSFKRVGSRCLRAFRLADFINRASALLKTDMIKNMCIHILFGII